MRLWLPLLLGSMITASVLSAAILAWDKRQARMNRRRVPESRLHLLELLGGWPGSWVTRRALSHKTRKLRYRLTAAFMALLHLAVSGAVTYWVYQQD